MISLSYYTGLISTVTNLFVIGSKAAQMDVPSSLTGKDKPWLPEGICTLVEIALLRNHPKGTKLHFERHHIVLQSPQSGPEKSYFKDNLPPLGVIRWWNSEDKTDLIKLTVAIASGLAIMPPTALPDGTDPGIYTSKEILNKYNNLSSVTKIHLFALDGIKALAKTYKMELETLRSPIDEKNDAQHEKYLKEYFKIFRSGLMGNGISIPLSEVGKKVKGNWRSFEFDLVAAYLNDLAELKWGTEREVQIRNTLTTVLSTKLNDYERFCKEASNSIIQEEFSNPLPSAPINIPKQPQSTSSSTSNTPTMGFQMVFPSPPLTTTTSSSLHGSSQNSSDAVINMPQPPPLDDND